MASIYLPSEPLPMISQSICEFTLVATTANNKTLSPLSEDFIFNRVLCTWQERSLWIGSRRLSVLKIHSLCYHNTGLKLSLYFAFIDNFDCPQQLPHKVIVKLFLQVSRFFHVDFHVLHPLIIGFLLLMLFSKIICRIYSFITQISSFCHFLPCYYYI